MDEISIGFEFHFFPLVMEEVLHFFISQLQTVWEESGMHCHEDWVIFMLKMSTENNRGGWV